jgi:hypothetical protein
VRERALAPLVVCHSLFISRFVVPRAWQILGCGTGCGISKKRPDLHIWWCGTCGRCGASLKLFRRVRRLVFSIACVYLY